MDLIMHDENRHLISGDITIISNMQGDRLSFSDISNETKWKWGLKGGGNKRNDHLLVLSFVSQIQINPPLLIQRISSSLLTPSLAIRDYSGAFLFNSLNCDKRSCWKTLRRCAPFLIPVLFNRSSASFHSLSFFISSFWIGTCFPNIKKQHKQAIKAILPGILTKAAADLRPVCCGLLWRPWWC